LGASKQGGKPLPHYSSNLLGTDTPHSGPLQQVEREIIMMELRSVTGRFIEDNAASPG